MAQFALYIGLEACELHFCTMRLYCKRTFIYRKLIGSQIRAFVFFIVMLEYFFGVCVLVIVKIMVKKALSQVCVNRSSGLFMELNAI